MLSHETARYALLTAGVWSSFLVFGYLQESVTRKFVWTETLVLLQSLTNVLVSGAVLVFSGERLSGGVRWFDWAVVGLGYFGAHSCGLAALQHIIYPLQVVIKSCKAVPVMLGEMAFAHVHPSLGKVVSVLQLSVGVGMFMYFSDLAKHGKDKDGSSSSSSSLVYGVGLSIGALVCDAIYGPYQNRICQHHNPSAWHLMFNMNLYQLVFALFAALQTDQLSQAALFVNDHAAVIGPRLLGFCLSMTLGNIFIYQMQRHYGALAVAKTTTVRKLVSVTLSVLLFGHSLTAVQILAILVVFLAPLSEKSIDHSRKHHPHSHKSAAEPAAALPASADSTRRPATRQRTKAAATNGARSRSSSRKKRT